MIADWFAIYLVAKGFNLEETAAGFWVPFLAADLGNFFGGGFSSWLIRRGWPVGRARRLVIVGGGLGVLALVPAAFASGFLVLLACFAVATFSYAAMSTMALSLPADLYQSRAVASVSGLSGTAAGLGTIGATYLIGIVADRFSFTPILLVASVIPLVAAPSSSCSSATPPRPGRGWSRSYEARRGCVVLSGETLFRSFFDPPRERRLGRGFAWTRVADRRVTPRLRRLLRRRRRPRHDLGQPVLRRGASRRSRRGSGSWRTAGGR